MNIIDSVAPIKECRIKGRTQEWFDGETVEKITIRDKLFKKFQKARLHVDKEINTESRNVVKNLIKIKKQVL